MRFLMAAMRYPTGPGESYLTTELAEALVEAGHEVEVLHLDWDDTSAGLPTTRTTCGGVRVLRVSARRMPWLGGAIGHAAKFLLSGRAAARAARRLDLASFDAFIAWMPAIAIAPLLRLVCRAGVPHRHLLIWDFFPDHYREIGGIPGGPAFWLARWLEQRMLARFTTIFCTMPGNVDYLRSRFRIAPAQRVEVMPVWTRVRPVRIVDRAEERGCHRLPAECPIAVFGGQMVPGRGFEQILEAARLAAEAGSPLHFLLIGDGSLAPMLAERAASLPNVTCRPPLPREDYRRLIAACDAGLAATVAGVSSYSFPSKILDYLAAGLPVVAALETDNDVAAMIERFAIGALVPLGDAAALFRQAERLATDPLARARAKRGGRRCLEEVLDVRHTVSALLRASR